MVDINDLPDVPGDVSIKRATHMLGITNKLVYRWVFLVFGEGTGKDGSSLFEVSVRRGNQRCISPSSETDLPKTRKTQVYTVINISPMA